MLVNQDGHLKSSNDYKGKYMLIYFGFTYCPDICPSELVKLGDIVEILGEFSNNHPAEMISREMSFNLYFNINILLHLSSYVLH